MTTPPTLAPGMTIANRFRLDRHLGQGGMGSVWMAWHLTLNIEVAIKFIDPQYVSNRDAWSRFSQEAMAAAKIKSPHVVSVLDFGTDEHHRPYLAMELLQGEELASLLEREPVLPVPMVARIITQACKGLARAHSARIIHRDIKPDNLFLCEDEDGFLLKILDFGIAKMTSTGISTHRTGTGQVLGTPLFMSPEQAYGNRPVDHRSDLYSLAVVAYRCLTGYVPFQSDGVGELIVAITTQTPRPPSHLRAGLPPGLDPWFQRALAKDPELRFRSAKEMADSFSVACGMTPSVESTAQFSALNAADLTGPLSGPLGETPADAVPLVRRGSPSLPPSSRRQAVTLQGTAASYRNATAHASRVRWLIAGAVFAGLGVAGGLLWRLTSSPPPLATTVPSAPRLGAPLASAQEPPFPSASAAPGSSAPVVSINSLPPEQTFRPYPNGNNFRPAPKGSAPKASAPATTAPAPATTTTPAPATTPAPTKHDYGL
jgi:serine/threonine-protein kinase